MVEVVVTVARGQGCGDGGDGWHHRRLWWWWRVVEG